MKMRSAYPGPCTGANPRNSTETTAAGASARHSTTPVSPSSSRSSMGRCRDSTRITQASAGARQVIVSLPTSGGGAGTRLDRRTGG
jgi:hypothetical protein